jgi:hypothetical protein
MRRRGNLLIECIAVLGLTAAANLAMADGNGEEVGVSVHCSIGGNSAVTRIGSVESKDVAGTIKREVETGSRITISTPNLGVSCGNAADTDKIERNVDKVLRRARRALGLD